MVGRSKSLILPLMVFSARTLVRLRPPLMQASYFPPTWENRSRPVAQTQVFSTSIQSAWIRTTLNGVDVLTGESATDALQTLDFALQQVSGLRAELGAVQTRFESTISNLGVVTENLSAARSRIQDADFAAETANLTRAQILQQAGISVLAQANAAPQNVLALLN